MIGRQPRAWTSADKILQSPAEEAFRLQAIGVEPPVVALEEILGDRTADVDVVHADKGCPSTRFVARSLRNVDHGPCAAM